jgi:acetoin utilization protein AcuB
MTPCPQTIKRDDALAHAREVMSRFRIRHLPVLDGDTLVGLLSDRDLAVAEKFGDPFRTTVGEVMSPEPYFALPASPLSEVADEMARRRIGAAVILDDGRVVGVFTAVDALRAIGEERGRPAQIR